MHSQVLISAILLESVGAAYELLNVCVFGYQPVNLLGCRAHVEDWRPKRETDCFSEWPAVSVCCYYAQMLN